MSWHKSIVDSKGVTVEFWEITEIHFKCSPNLSQSVARVVYGGWVSKQVYESGGRPQMIGSIEMPASGAVQIVQAGMAAAQAGVLALDKFQGAQVDV